MPPTHPKQSVLTRNSSLEILNRPRDIRFDEINFENYCEIGKGAFGTVYKAKYNKVPVAVKVLHNQNIKKKELDYFINMLG